MLITYVYDLQLLSTFWLCR